MQSFTISKIENASNAFDYDFITLNPKTSNQIDFKTIIVISFTGFVVLSVLALILFYLSRWFANIYYKYFKTYDSTMYSQLHDYDPYKGIYGN